MDSVSDCGELSRPASASANNALAMPWQPREFCPAKDCWIPARASSTSTMQSVDRGLPVDECSDYCSLSVTSVSDRIRVEIDKLGTCRIRTSSSLVVAPFE